MKYSTLHSKIISMFLVWCLIWALTSYENWELLEHSCYHSMTRPTKHSPIREHICHTTALSLAHFLLLCAASDGSIFLRLGFWIWVIFDYAQWCTLLRFERWLINASFSTCVHLPPLRLHPFHFFFIHTRTHSYLGAVWYFVKAFWSTPSALIPCMIVEAMRSEGFFILHDSAWWLLLLACHEFCNFLLKSDSCVFTHTPLY